jgi:predicted acylesterase/phospholipase RssA/CRP-like cAMP-binding protein
VGCIWSLRALGVEHHTWNSLLAHHLYHHHTSDMAVHVLLYKFDIHDECHYSVRFLKMMIATFLLTLFDSLLIVLAAVSTVSWFVRYRFLNMYTRLPPEPQRKEPQLDLYPDSQEGDSKPGLANYLDEFLEAIKVFGYLERPVFHELTRTMQTKKLIAGETLLLEEEKGFCLVVDGLVQIFVKSLHERHRGKHDEPMGGLFGDEEEQHLQGGLRYQLLTEVKNGAAMSSLFSILSLFTEDVKLRTEESDSSASSIRQTQRTPDSIHMSSAEIPSSPKKGWQGEGRPATRENEGKEQLPGVPPLTLEPVTPTSEQEACPPRRPSGPGRGGKSKSAHPDIVARAMVDTTIAIIPASAFRRLTRTYPRATAHIVQVILTRLQRVTLSTAHQYLGLTTEVLHMEQLMNRYTSYDLPNHLRGDALDRLKDKFKNDRDRIGHEEGMKGIALHNPVSNGRRSTATVRKEAALSAKLAAARSGSFSLPYSNYAPEGERHVSPGDLISNMQISRRGHRFDQTSSHSKPYCTSQDRLSPITSPPAEREQPLFRPGPQNSLLHRQQSVDEDSIFRESVLTCMIKSLGLTMTAKDAFRKGNLSIEHSPRLLSYDSRRQTAVFNNAFGFMDPYEASADGESESAISTSLSSLPGSMHGRNPNDELIEDIEIVFFPQGSVLVEQGERNPGVYYVIDGFLDVSIPVEEKEDRSKHDRATYLGAKDRSHISGELFPPPRRTAKNSSRTSSTAGKSRDGGKHQGRKSLFLIKPGGIAGYIGTISSYRSFTDVTAKTDVYVGFLPRASLERFTDKNPVVLLTMAKRLTSLLPRLILHIDFALEWVQVNAGQVIHHQGDDSDAIYIVLNGRLRSVLEKDDGTMRVVGEFGQGESIGELEVMTESTRPATLHAIRDTELAKFPRSLFNSLAQEHPGITIQITKLIAQRMRALIDDPMVEKGSEKASVVSTHNVSSSLNLRTVAILPVTAGVPVIEFGHRLLTAFTQIGIVNGVTSLNQAAILNVLGRHAFSRMGKLKLSQYLADLEEKFGMVLYVADTNVNAPWTQTCISQADCILLVGLAEGSPNVGEYERFLLGMKTTARKELVLLHAERYSPPGRTRKWLKNRVWINGSHHHIQMAFRTTPEATPHAQTRRFGLAIKQRVQVIQAEIQKYTSRRVRQTPSYSAETPYKGDFHRLARRLCGKSLGLVLGGGGARGISQIGIIRALEEAGIPIDIVGGTSIGAFIGALYARDADVVPMYGRAKKFAGRMGSMWRFALDLTYPSASYTTGHEFNRGIFKTFGNSQIEDFWLEFYCNTTNISKSRSEIHTSGYVWRYVRASMSLAGLIPPLCDEGSMLLDGGYVDNLTVAHMKSLGADVVFAIDVGSLDDDTPQQFGDSLSGFWAAINRWNPFSSYPNPPTLSEIQARLAYVSSHDALERAKTTPGCLYMRPPIDAYGTLDFAKFDEIYELGYAYGKEFLARTRETGVLKGVVGHWDESEEEKGLRRTMAPRRASI